MKSINVDNIDACWRGVPARRNVLRKYVVVAHWVSSENGLSGIVVDNQPLVRPVPNPRTRNWLESGGSDKLIDDNENT